MASYRWMPVALLLQGTTTAAIAETCMHGDAADAEPAVAREFVGPPAPVAFTPAIAQTKPPGPAPKGMVWVPGGTFWMGAQVPSMRDALPVHPVEVSGFWMDRTEVTNAQFERFVRSTRYVTVAERAPLAKDFPGAPPETLVAGSVVFTAPKLAVALDNPLHWWRYQRGADWRHPDGPGSSIRGRAQHPVVHVAYEDVEAYARWIGARLPTEAEYEFAARGGRDRAIYPWGDTLQVDGKAQANTFQGHFPDRDTAVDGFAGTAPVATYPPNGFGLFDIAGNVWEWTADWYRPDTYALRAATGTVARDPRGPDDSFDPSEPGVAKRVHRGGSYLCTDQYCARYVAGGRGKGEPATATNHLGFRCVRDVVAN